jgi:ATP-dependent Clp protease ATP-binding subunit ClpA
VPFGETEKAHEDISSIFAQVMDDGGLADSEGTLVN